MMPAGGALAQIGLLCSVLIATVLWPRAGQPVLLVSITGTDAVGLRALADEGLAVIGAGRLPHSFVVYRPDTFPILSVLQQGFLPLAAPATLCSPIGARG
jgi:hypothetical protein